MQVDYTLDELVDAVASRLAAAGLDRQANGQVSAFPDRRTLRYYTTIGLMDRPDTVRDRQAIYSDRHVAQAVVVKRLQSSGLTLAAIQAQVAGLPPAAIDAIASGQSGPVGADARSRQRGFWGRSDPASPPAVAGPPVGGGTPPGVAAVRPRAMSPSRVAAAASGQGSAIWATGPAPSEGVATAAAAGDVESVPVHLQVLRLAPGINLELATDQALTAADVTGIRGAASALLHHLAAAGFIAADSSRDQLERDCR